MMAENIASKIEILCTQGITIPKVNGYMLYFENAADQWSAKWKLEIKSEFDIRISSFVY